MRPIDRFKAGDPLSASRFNALREALSPRGLAIGSGLDLAGDALRRARRSPITAKLSGAASPYSWTQRIETAPGTWSDGPLSGTSNAYEVNGVAGLADAHARLFPDPTGGWRFQSIRAGSGGGGDPITCLCWHDGDRPATLSYTADFYHAASGTLLGSRSGTLAYMDPVTFAKAGGGTCTLAPPSGVAGWIGDWSDYCYILHPDDSVTGVERPHCMEDTAPSTCADTGGTRCRYLWVACSAIGVGGVSPFGRVGVAETYYNAFSSSYVCLAPSVVFSGSSLACSPFSLTYYGGSGRFGVSVDLTVTE